MQTTSSISEVRQAVSTARQQGQIIGCVPTMGALHQGHLSLIRAAREQSDFVVVSIFVNPTQFGPQEDFSKYPRPLEKDLELCQAAGADLVFHPEAEAVYGQDPQITVKVGSIADRWEGASRPDLFDGVATIVAKLFGIMQPDRAFFGAKDYQQQQIIKLLCRDLNLPVEIITCPTIRNEDGLALSSRNAYLSAEERQTALAISRTLRDIGFALKQGERSIPKLLEQMRTQLRSTAGLDLDYATLADPITLEELTHWQSHMVGLIAARVGKTRLIDNQEYRED